MFTPNDLADKVLFSDYRELFSNWLALITTTIEYHQILAEAKEFEEAVPQEAEYMNTLRNIEYHDYEVVEDTLTFELSGGFDMKLGIAGKSGGDSLLFSLYASDIEVAYAKVSLNTKAAYTAGAAYCCKEFNTALVTYLDVLCTHRDYQGEGYGTMLIEILTDLLPKPIVGECLPFGRISLSKKELLRWYRNRGFKQVVVECTDYVYYCD